MAAPPSVVSQLPYWPSYTRNQCTLFNSKVEFYHTPPPREISLITSPPAVKLHEAKNSVYSLLALPAAPTRKKLPHLSDERLH